MQNKCGGKGIVLEGPGIEDGAVYYCLMCYLLSSLIRPLSYVLFAKQDYNIFKLYLLDAGYN